MTKGGSDELDLSVWKTVTLGTHVNPEELVDDLRRVGCRRYLGLLDHVLKQIKMVSVQTDINLFLVSLAELGFVGWATRIQILERAGDLGLGPCPVETGMQLRRQYLDQTRNEVIFLASEPLVLPTGLLSILSIGRDEELWLKPDHGGYLRGWHPEDVWAFTK